LAVKKEDEEIEQAEQNEEENDEKAINVSVSVVVGFFIKQNHCCKM